MILNKLKYYFVAVLLCVSVLAQAQKADTASVARPGELVYPIPQDNGNPFEQGNQ